MSKKTFSNIAIVIIAGISLFCLSCEKDADSQEVDPVTYSYPVAGTGQAKFYDNLQEISAPVAGSSFYGQDAQYSSNTPSYKDNGDGTVTDLVTGLMWQKSPGFNGDGVIDYSDKMSYAGALAGASSFKLAGYTDWRLPSIKELYSLIVFSGANRLSVLLVRHNTCGYVCRFSGGKCSLCIVWQCHRIYV